MASPAPARIGWVTYSKIGKTLHYQGRAFQSLKGSGFKANYFDTATGQEFWISGPKRNGADQMYSQTSPVPIDADARQAYWTEIRRQPERVDRAVS